MPQPRVLIAGGSGFLGQALARELVARYDVVILTRHAEHYRGPGRAVTWDARTPGDWRQELESAAAIVNFTGRSVNARPTAKNRQDMLRSRVDSVHAIRQAIAQCSTPPTVWLQASGIAYYGNAGDRPCDETAPRGQGFLADLCHQWEAGVATEGRGEKGEGRNDAAPPTRPVILRIGLVLGHGGVLPVLAKLARYGLGGSAGTGRQYMSWIHLADLLHMMRWAIERPALAGLYNAVAPHPVTNADFMRTLRHTLHRPWSPPAPALAVRLGAWAMGTDGSLALEGQRVTPRRFADAGFTWRFNDLATALRDCLQA